MAVEDIGVLWNTKQPGYDDTADIQAALKAFLYGSYTYNSANADKTLLPNPSLARHLQELRDDVTDLETQGIGSGFKTTSQISGSNTTIPSGYIAVASDSTGGSVSNLYASAYFTNDAPTTNLIDGILWVDKDSEAYDAYIYDSTQLPANRWIKFANVQNIINAKGDILIGSSADSLDNLTVGANGTVLTANSAATLGVSWSTIDTESIIISSIMDAY